MFETEKKLKDGIRSLQVENGMLITKINDYMYAYNDLKKQNEALKEELVRCYRIHDLFNSMPEQFKELESLKEENKQLKEENEALTRCVEKGMDCIDISLLEQVSKLEGENRLLNHKLSSMKDQLSVLTNEREKQKVKAYHYDMYRNSLAEECVFNKDVNIGSSRCSKCPNNRGCDDINHWVKCALMPNGKPKK